MIGKTRSFAAFLLLFCHSLFASTPPLSDEQASEAAANYQQYCALCHGEDRQGYANDHAPSLRTNSLMTSGEREMRLAIAYGRKGTPMASFLDEMGGPMEMREIRSLVQWLRSHVAVKPYEHTYAAVQGNVDVGREIYFAHCASCHGENGEGATGTALGNPSMLSLTTDQFLKYAIEHGRDGTEMPAFREILAEDAINDVTAFLRSRATGWTLQKPARRAPPTADNYVLNPDSPNAEFVLEDDLYVMSTDLLNAQQEQRRMIILDTRSISQWLMVNLEGSVPIPYYSSLRELDEFVKNLPNDGTPIVIYCECPRAASEYVNSKLRERGYSNTAVLWEGIRGWISLGYPVFMGEVVEVPLPIDDRSSRRADSASR